VQEQTKKAIDSAGAADGGPDPMAIAVNALGLTQITAWGTSYYCLGVLAKPIVAETGWTMTTVFLGFSVALLVMGFISTWVGRLIDRIGARAVMSVGTIVVSAGLLALSQVRDPLSYLAVWAVIGIGMRCCLYDAAFAALVQVTPTRGRKAISYLTLYGAYASTVFWVIGHYLNDAYGWRGTLMIFAAINLAVCLPLNWIGLSRREAPPVAAAATHAAASPDGPVLEGRMRVVGIVLFALIMSINGFVFGVISLQLVPLARGGGPRRRNGGLGRLAQGPWSVRRPARRDLLRPQPQGDDDRAHCHRRRAGGGAAALPGPRRLLVARCLHPAAGRIPGRHHHRSGRRPARALRRHRAMAPCSG
jgi:MFS family permease